VRTWRRRTGTAGPFCAAIGWFAVGAGVGALASWLVPDPIAVAPRIRGTSLVVAPLAGGFALAAFGWWRRRSGHEPTSLATFVGGASFAFGSALARFWMLA
jgi:hypothetical protein